jgi:hypothetical protein
MLTLRRLRGSGDLEPMLRCSACQRALRIQEAWLAWNATMLDAEPKWLHRDCHKGQAAALFGSQRLLLWRVSDVFCRLLRATEGRDQCDFRVKRGGKSGQSC